MPRIFHGWKDCGSIFPYLVRVGTVSCVGVPLRLVADGGPFVCPGLVAVPGTFLREARFLEDFNPKIAGEDVVRCMERLSTA